MAGPKHRRFAQHAPAVMLHLADRMIGPHEKPAERAIEARGPAGAALGGDEAHEQPAPLGLQLPRPLPIPAVDGGSNAIREIEDGCDPFLHHYVPAGRMPSQPSLISRSSEATSFSKSVRLSRFACSSVREA